MERHDQLRRVGGAPSVQNKPGLLTPITLNRVLSTGERKDLLAGRIIQAEESSRPAALPGIPRKNRSDVAADALHATCGKKLGEETEDHRSA